MTINPKFQNKEIKKGLYIIPTPIGNLGDITYRAIEILKKSDFILCEDTRISRKLMEKFEVKSKLLSNHKFNEKKNLSLIMNHLKNDKVISLVSDAGTPTLNDPGRLLISQCYEFGIKVIPVPGPSAVLCAISVSGFSDNFYFCGFLGKKSSEIERYLSKVKIIKASLVFFMPARDLSKNSKFFFFKSF